MLAKKSRQIYGSAITVLKFGGARERENIKTNKKDNEIMQMNEEKRKEEEEKVR